MDHWIKFDTEKIRLLRDDYVGCMESIKQGLPDINLNSRKAIMDFFEKTFQIELKSTRIKELSNYINAYGADSDEREVITGIVYYFKMKYMVKNYLDCILKHEKKGVVELREYFGSIVMPNRQPLPASKETYQYVIDGSETALTTLREGVKKWDSKLA